MKCVLFRAFLMILVALPLGTFRTLHALLRTAHPAASQASSNEVMRSLVFDGCRRDVLVCERSSDLPGGKIKFRSWADVTFLASESPEVHDTCIEVVPLLVIEGPQSPMSRPCDSLSPLVAYRTPREAIIAACTLLI